MDRAGLVGGWACALHCALWPLLLASASAGVAGKLAEYHVLEEALRWGLMALALASMAMEWKKHRTMVAWLLFIPGLALLGTGSLQGHEGKWHLAWMVAGGMLVGAGHLVHLRANHHAHLRKQSSCHHCGGDGDHLA